MNVNGFALKGIKRFKGHEGEPCYQGNIYFENQKVGWFSSSYTMGPMDFRFVSTEFEKRFTETAEAFHKAYPSGFLKDTESLAIDTDFNIDFDSEGFIYELLTIDHAEKEYKQCLKTGNPLMVYTYSNRNVTAYSFRHPIPYENIVEYFNKKHQAEVVLYADSLKVFDIKI